MAKFSYRATIDNKEKLIHAAAYGECVEVNIINMYKNLGLALKSNKLNCLVIDVSQLHITYDYPSVLNVLQKLNQVVDNIALARVISPTDTKSGLIEAFAEKHGLTIKNFENYNDAITWLQTLNRA
ncbi:hypothetical protein HUZ36_01645 [Pseudoalteromonas sp. McH1-7]|uniref:Uncharacterized protein n=1 Tax=Pseudoalteromonas peptidolytica F12-50-A1 TaxID=1315280 RepID=A0A8I0T4W7_9GAMM|nr:MULTISPECIES: hypothetical protein [Pseudoalteromonas]MBE0346757.1 hypothetical protein [Pseudoalteromonas peptidolytica F12-50-A1]MDW7549934.1 hypothetical protein [Pseudoalteromonas peptidolytica]NLR13667.1 hypothetical protein [Pseudoalteromonas peptidolytica]NUZ09474.1 hypothetical protein [Pseudoalteromonas sp. McH1-7]RXE98999.1 hypothetical protein D9603_16755 [Pseudoalteromonas sp. PS5]